jgi:hypothetical protein
MSENIRFAAIAAALFAMSYMGVSWVMAGTPIVRLAPEQAQPDDQLVTGSTPRRATAAVQPGDGNPERDALRRAALQASTAYALAPCDEVAKAVMIGAISSYARATMKDCGAAGCDFRKINLTAATFSTPLDVQLREAVGAAFDQRGISIDDFPSPLRSNVAMLVRGRGAPVPVCTQTQARIMR